MTAKEEADKYFSAGVKCSENKDYEGAIHYFTKAIELGKDDKVIYRKRGFAYAGIENYTKAIEDFTKAIELGEDDISVYGARGYAYIYRENYPKAIEDFTKVIELDEKDKDAYAGRGFAYAGEGNYQKAIEDYTKAIELGTHNEFVYIMRGMIYVYKGDDPKAIDDFKEAIKLNKSGNEKNKNTDDNDYILNEIKLTDNILNLIDDILQNNESECLRDDDSINLIRLVCLCYYLMAEIKIKPSEMSANKFVHYTKASTLRYLLKKDHTAKLRLNNAVYMNDPEEGQILKRVLLGQNKELENLFKDEDVKNYTYLTCFSLYSKKNELPMWVHYGDGGKGVGLVFSNSFFDKTDLYSVIYIDVKNPDIEKLNKNIQGRIEKILNLLQEDEIKNNTRTEFKVYVNIILNYVSYLFKDKAYEYENEVRILNYRDYAGSDISGVCKVCGNLKSE